MGRLLVCWALGCGVVYLFLFGIGKLVFAEWGAGLAFVAAGSAALWLALRLLRGTEPETAAESA